MPTASSKSDCVFVTYLARIPCFLSSRTLSTSSFSPPKLSYK
jgi:hypothetical protein